MIAIKKIQLHFSNLIIVIISRNLCCRACTQSDIFVWTKPLRGKRLAAFPSLASPCRELISVKRDRLLLSTKKLTGTCWRCWSEVTVQNILRSDFFSWRNAELRKNIVIVPIEILSISSAVNNFVNKCRPVRRWAALSYYFIVPFPVVLASPSPPPPRRVDEINILVTDQYINFKEPKPFLKTNGQKEMMHPQRAISWYMKLSLSCQGALWRHVCCCDSLGFSFYENLKMTWISYLKTIVFMLTSDS